MLAPEHKNVKYYYLHLDNQMFVYYVYLWNCLPNYYLILKNPYSFLVPLMISTQRGPKMQTYKNGLGKFFWVLTPVWCSIFSTYLASKISILWASHLDSPLWPEPFSVVPYLDILGRLKKVDTQLNLEWLIQVTLHRSSLPSADISNKGYPFLFVFTRWWFYHSLPFCILSDILHFLLSQALVPIIIIR